VYGWRLTVSLLVEVAQQDTVEPPRLHEALRKSSIFGWLRQASLHIIREAHIREGYHVCVRFPIPSQSAVARASHLASGFTIDWSIHVVFRMPSPPSLCLLL
jgi:hypothetical protein